jgi:tetratricopeptide (TPR) repeat protein
LVADSDQNEDAAVRHLVELGYVDPHESRASRAQRRHRLESQLRRAVALINGNRGPEAIDLLSTLLAEDSDWIAPRQLLAELYFSQANLEAAQTHAQWLAHHNIGTPRLALITGAIALQHRDLRGALDDLEYASHVEPLLPRVWSLLGAVQLRLGQSEQAQNSFQRALQHNSTDALALDGLAALALGRKQFEAAADWALKALDCDMRLPHAHYHLGMALAALGRPEPAMHALLACARLEPSRAAPYCQLSRIAGKLGDRDRASEYRNTARQIIRRRRTRGGT